MRNFGVHLALAALSAGAAAAAPVQIGYDQVQWETVEDFQSLAPGSGGGSGPVFYDGFSVETGPEHWALVSDEPPCSDADRCLRSYLSPVYSPIAGTPIPTPTAMFTNFRDGTRSFGIRLPGTFDDFSGSVVGASGTLSLQTLGIPADEQAYGPLTMAFSDPGGIFSFSITGPAEYDDVVTSPAAIPLPPAGVLLLLALGGLGLAGRRRTTGRG